MVHGGYRKHIEPFCDLLAELLVLQGRATPCERFAQYGMTPADSAKTEITMRFPVKNCSKKVDGLRISREW